MAGIRLAAAALGMTPAGTLAADDVWAVGTNEGRTLVMHWDGHRWNVLPRPSVTSAWLQAAAPGRGCRVWVVGYRMTDIGSVSRPLFLRWDGHGWRSSTSEEPEGAVYGLASPGSSIRAVGTTSPCSCFVAPPLVEARCHSRAAPGRGGNVGKAYIMVRRRSTGTYTQRAGILGISVSFG